MSRTAEQIVAEAKKIIDQYNEKWGPSFADAHIQSLQQRAANLAKTSTIDEGLKAMNLSKDELAVWEKYHDDQHVQKQKEMYGHLITSLKAKKNQQELKEAEFCLNNNKRTFTVEERTEMLAQLSEVVGKTLMFDDNGNVAFAPVPPKNRAEKRKAAKNKK